MGDEAPMWKFQALRDNVSFVCMPIFGLSVLFKARRPATAQINLPSYYLGSILVYLYVLRSFGNCFTCDDLCDFAQVEVLEKCGNHAVKQDD